MTLRVEEKTMSSKSLDKIWGYDIEVFKYDWSIVFINLVGEKFAVVNDSEKLKRFYNKRVKALIGYNNHNYDDIILASLLIDFKKTPFEISQDIIERNVRYYGKLSRPTVDVYKDLGGSLKKHEAIAGESIQETEVDFKINRKLTPEEMRSNLKYNEHDVKQTLKLFNKMKPTWDAKFETIKEFELDPKLLTATNAKIVSSVLKGVDQTRGLFYHDRIENKFSGEAYEYYMANKWVVPDYQYLGVCEISGKPIYGMPKLKYQVDFQGYKLKLGKGGIHGARPNYISRDVILADIMSQYPSAIENLKLLEPESMEKYSHIKYMRTKVYKHSKDPEIKKKDIPAKLILNTTYGCFGAKGNSLKNTQSANTITIYNQLSMLELCEDLDRAGVKLIQANTDGIVFEKTDIDYKSIISKWEKKFNFTMEYTNGSIFQRDVNNYILKTDAGVKKVGFVKEDSGAFNHCNIIKEAIVQYHLNNIPVWKTITECKDVKMFQMIFNVGRESYSEVTCQLTNKKFQFVNRVFATKKSVNFLMKKNASTGNFECLGNFPSSATVHNKDVNSFNISEIDYKYYIEIAEKNIIGG